jgi:aminoglycoside/choline kinase family phosphotransferase
VQYGEQRMVLMNASRKPDGPPVRNGRPYSAIAHLAEDVIPFAAIARVLRAFDFSAPAIYHSDFEHGLLLLEDLGDERVVAGDPPAPIEDRYEAAVDVLASLHAQRLPASVPLADPITYQLPRYDMDAFLIEAELLIDWYMPHMGVSVNDEMRASFTALWREALQPAVDAPTTWVLRDYHSPNLLWLGDRDGISRIGILDFQDALLGPAAYDVASLLQDARVDVPESLEVALLSRYARNRVQADKSFDTASFIRLYATLATQRNTKILGIFARLNHRDGKPQYLRHMPRIWAYLHGALRHPELAGLAAWYGEHVPAPKAM